LGFVYSATNHFIITKRERFLKPFLIFSISKEYILKGKMHALQPKHKKLNSDETDKVLKNFNIALAQLPKISKKDPALPEGCDKGDVVEISRPDEVYYRVVI
jgi:DNA-directed RNA polymerase subunit H